MVMSLDGEFAFGGRVRALSNPVDHQLLLALRALADVVVVGAGTARAESYGPVHLTEDHRRLRSRHGRPTSAPPLAIVTGSGNLPAATRLSSADAPAVVITAGSSAADPRGHVDPSFADVITAGAGTLDCAAAIHALRQRGMRHILCEGGPGLLSALVEADLVDELCLTLSPTVAGPQCRPDQQIAVPSYPSPRGMALRHVLIHDEFIFLRYCRPPEVQNE